MPLTRLASLIAIGACAAAFCLATASLAQPAAPQPVTPSVTVDPDQPGATPHWTITLGAGYCGGYQVGDGVYLSPQAPLSLPATMPDGSALFAGQPAAVDWVNGALRIAPGAGLVQS